MAKYRNAFILVIFIISLFFQINHTESNIVACYAYNIFIKSENMFKQSLEVYNKPYGGEYKLPLKAQFVRTFLRGSKIESYRLSSGFKNLKDSEGINTRFAIVEGAYPIPYSDKSHYLIALSNEQLPEDSTILASKEGVNIVCCP